MGSVLEESIVTALDWLMYLHTRKISPTIDLGGRPLDASKLACLYMISHLLCNDGLEESPSRSESVSQCLHLKFQAGRQYLQLTTVSLGCTLNSRGLRRRANSVA